MLIIDLAYLPEDHLCRDLPNNAYGVCKWSLCVSMTLIMSLNGGLVRAQSGPFWRPDITLLHALPGQWPHSRRNVLQSVAQRFQDSRLIFLGISFTAAVLRRF